MPSADRLFKKVTGFTLAELLIALVLMGCIAVYTIPKVLNSTNTTTINIAAHEAAAMVANAYKQHFDKGLVTVNTTPKDLIPYLNYVSIEPDFTLIDAMPPWTAYVCWSGDPCLKLHNGGTLLLMGYPMTALAPNRTIVFVFDPDGQYSGSTTDGPSKSVMFALTYTGRLLTISDPGFLSNLCLGPWCPPGTNLDPSWFHW
jgi:prepilin-type N-terminal cleavage/methylation domain-containing protein